MARLHSLQDTTSSLQGELERKRRNRPARRTLSHQLRYSLVRTDDEEELALVLPFVGIVGQHSSYLDDRIAQPLGAPLDRPPLRIESNRPAHDVVRQLPRNGFALDVPALGSELRQAVANGGFAGSRHERRRVGAGLDLRSFARHDFAPAEIARAQQFAPPSGECGRRESSDRGIEVSAPRCIERLRRSWIVARNPATLHSGYVRGPIKRTHFAGSCRWFERQSK